MNVVYRLVWNRSRRMWVVASELATTRRKPAGRSRLPHAARRIGATRRLAAAFASCIALFPVREAAAQCAADGGVITTSTTATCTVSVAGSTLTVQSPATYTGWVDFTGSSTALVVQAGASMVAQGSTDFGFITVHGPSTAWTLTNDGTLSNAQANVDLIRLATSGNYTIVNTGTIQNTSTDTTSHVLEAASNANLTLTNTATGVMSASGGSFVLNYGGSALTVDNAGTMTAATNRVFAGAGSTTYSITNRGTIETFGANAAIDMDGPGSILNAGRIARSGAADVVVWMGPFNNTLTLESTSTIVGDVDAESGTDTLVLGGASGSGLFTLSAISATTSGSDYRGFDIFEKRDAGAWTLTGTGTSNWSLLAGTLVVGSGASLNGTITNPANATGPVSLQISGALAGSGVGISMGGPFTNSLVLGSGATFGTRTFSHVGGTTVLTGPVAFPNAVTVSAGTLQIGDNDTGTGGAITGAITNNASLVFNRSDTLTYANAISGTGSVTQAGSGATALTAQSTYSGGTVVNAGTLQIGDTPNTDYGSIPAGLIRGAVTVNPGGTLVVTGRNSMGSSGTASQNINTVTLLGATMTHTGQGDNGWGVNYHLTGSTMRTTGTGQYSFGGPTAANPTTITVHAAAVPSVIAGRARLREGNAGNTLNITVEDGAAPIDLLVSANVDEAGGTPNTHALAKLGPGNLTLTGAGTWTAGTTISDGTFQIGNGGTTGSLLGNVVDNAALVFNRSDATAFAGIVSGTGTLTQAGSGTLALSGINTYSGGTFLNAGVLAVSADANLGAVGGSLTFNGGTLRTTASLTSTRPVTLASGGTIDNAGNAATFSGVFGGAGSLTSTGAGTLTLGGANTYAGGTVLNGGTLSVSSDGNLGAAAGPLTFNGGTLLTTAGITSGRAVNLAGNGAINNGGNTDAFTGVMSGTGSLTFNGAGTSILTGENTHTGTTTVAAGTLQLGSGGGTGSVAGPIVDNAALVVNRSGTVLFPQPISGTGSFAQVGPGTTVLGADNTWSGGTTVSAGTLQVGNNAASGDIAGSVLNNATLAFARTDLLTFDNLVTGTGAVVKNAAGTVALTAANTYAGTTAVNAGTLWINGNQSAATGAVSVANAATLGGTGTTGGSIAIADGGHLAPGNSIGTLSTTGSLVLSPGSILDWEFGQAGVPGGPLNDLLTVGGALTLDGTLNVTVPSGGNFIAGVYRIIDYGGALTDNGLALGTLPSPGPFFVQTAVANQVNLVNAQGLGPLSFWDGAGPFNNGQVNGGSGTWLASPSDAAWTDASGGVNAPWQADGFAIFQGTPGTVAVDNSAGDVTFGGAQFTVGGYTITGAPLTTGIAASPLRVGDGTSNGAAMIATISAPIQGAGGIDKTDLGTLVLSGINAYTGGTTISGGTLSVSSDNQLGAATGELIFNGGTLLTTAGVVSTRPLSFLGSGTIDNGGNVDTFSGNITGGAPTFAGGGTTILTGTNTYGGTTTIAAGTLQIGDGGTGGSVVSPIVDNAALVVNRSQVVQFSLPISGSGSLAQVGPGTTILTADNTYSGGTTITAGTLLIGNGGTTGSIAGNVANNAALAFSRSNAITFAGLVSGTGTLTQAGTGTLVLTGASTYTGATAVDVGTLWINGDQGAATGAVSVANGASLGGIGITGGNVTIADGAHIAPGNSVGEFTTTGDLFLSGGSILDYEFGQANVPGGPLNDLLTVGGDLTLDGTLNVTVASGGSFLAGAYRIIDYGGALTDSGLALGALPSAGPFFVQTAVAGQVNLINAEGLGPLNVWDGAGPLNNGQVNGGSGTWLASASDAAWTDSAGTVNAPWQADGFALFQATPGTVTVDTSAGAVTFSGAQFAVGGYLVTGAALTTSTAATQVRVGDGTVDGASMTATIAAPIQGSGGLEKIDLGTLVLSGSNSYTGGTQINGGTLSVSSDANLGDAAGALNFNAGTLLTTGSVATARAIHLTGDGIIDNAGTTDTFGGMINGAGALTLNGNGTSIFTADNANAGTTTVNDGTLQLGDGGSAGRVAGPIVNNAALSIDRNNALVITSPISGTGSLAQDGTGTTTLTGSHAYTGPTAVNAGTLFIDGDLSAATGTITVASGATLGGAGISGGDVTIADGGRLRAVQGQTLAMDSLTLGATSRIDVSLSDPGTTALFAVDGNGGGTGNLTLDGVLDITATGAFGAGVYRLVNYTGALTDNGLDFGTVPAGHVPGSDLVIQTSITQQVNLVNSLGAALTFWDGVDPAAFNNGVVNGGTGTWVAAGSDAWTDSAGALNGAWTANGFAIFQGAPGIVAVDNTAGSVSFSGAQFAVSGYTVVGEPLTTNTAGTVIRVGDGTAAGASMVANIDAVLQGSGGLTKTDLGTLVLGADNTYTGATTVAAGTLQLGNGGIEGNVPGNITDNATLVFNRSDDFSFLGVISGTGTLVKRGSGTLHLGATNTYTGPTVMEEGVLSVDSAFNLGTLGNPLIFDGGTMRVNSSFFAGRTVTLRPGGGTFDTNGFTTEHRGTISGPGSATKIGAGTVVIVGTGTYTGGTIISGGTLQIGVGDTRGSIIGNVLDNAALLFNRDGDVAFPGLISGTGTLTQRGPGALTLSGANTYAGTTTVEAGRLNINGDQRAATGAVNVAAGATLGGGGTTGGSITVAAGGRIAPGTSVGTLTTAGNLTLADGTFLDYEFGQANVPGGPLNDLLIVEGNLVLDGTLNVAVSPGGSLLGGVYRVIGHGGTLTDNGLVLGTLPTAGPFFVQTSVAQQVNLINAQGLGPLSFWDGNGSASLNNGQVDGGSGTWLASPTSDAWTDSTGIANAPWQADGFAVFQATPGAVAVDDSAGAVTFSGAQFTVGGYVLTGDALTTSTADTQIRVGDGTSAGAAMNATIGNVIQGSGGVHKTDLGTLVLTGANTYTGGTTIDGGTLSIAGDANLGNASGGLVFNAGTLLATGNLATTRLVVVTSSGTLDNGGTTDTFGGAISGAGALTFAGTGTTVLAADNAWTGGTTIAAGTLQVGMGGSSGTLVGNVANSGVLAFDRNDTLVFDGLVSGTGALAQIGTGTTVLTADHTHTGATAISAGTLQLGAGGATGSVPGDIVDNGALVVDRSNALTLSGAITGAGTFAQSGTGTTTLAGANGYTGTTAVNAGTLLIDGNQRAAIGAVSVASGATLGGTGATGGTVTVSDGGRLLGSQGQVFHMDSLALGATSRVDVTLTAPGTIGLFDIDGNGGGTGNLVLDGVLDITAAGTFGPGVYRVMQYSGALTDNGLDFGSVPTGFTPNVNLFVQTAVAQQVNLVNAQGAGPLEFWDGSNAAMHDNTAVDGGSGTWLAATGDFAWTDNTGTFNTPWEAGRFAIFQAAPGTVTVDNSTGNVTFSGAQFAVDGYVIDGEPLTTSTPVTVLRVGDGTVEGAAHVATIGAVVQGSGGIDKTDLGTLVLTADNTWSGGTRISAGTLQLGDGGTGGSVAGDIVDEGALVFARSDDVSHAGTISGSGSLTQSGSGVLTLTAANTYTGATNVNAGTLRVDGPLASTNTSVATGATLGGAGSIAGTVTIADGGRLAPGSGIGTLTLGALMLSPASQLDYEYGAPAGPNDLTRVNGDLALDGTLDITDTGGFDEGVYRVFDYTGALTDDGLVLGPLPAGFAPIDFVVQSAQIGQVNLVVSRGGLGLQFWDGSNTTGDGVIDGGSGTWTSTTSNWTSATGNPNAAWAAGFAVFSGAPGTVTLGESVAVGGMQFTSDGYRIVPDGAAQLVAADDAFNVRVDAGTTARIDAPIADGSSPATLIKNDAGTLVLAGANGYTGGTRIEGGTLQVGANENLGAASGPLALDAGTLRTTGSFDTARLVTLGDGGGVVLTDASTTLMVSGVVGGVGALVKQGDGVLVLGGTNTYGGGTRVDAGTLSVANDANLGASAVTLTLDGGALRNTAAFATSRAITLAAGGGTFDTQADLTSNGSIAGPGGLTKSGTGALVLFGTNTWTGSTQVAAGTLRAGAANTLPTASALIVAPGATLDLAGLDQTVASLANAGDVRTGGQADTRLAVTGAYVGLGGLLHLNAVLGGDDSPSDRLVIDGGTATGTTGMVVANIGGEGALTVRNGILVVDDVTGQTTAPGAFALVSPVFAGPYDYELFRGSVDASNAQAWYLRSSLDCSGPAPPDACPTPQPTPGPAPDPPTPQPIPIPIPNFRPEVSLYAALPGLGLRYGRAMLGTLHERVGEQDLLRGRDDLANRDAFNGGWVRVIGLHGDADGERRGIYADRGPRHDFEMIALQGGIDVYRAEHEDGQRDHAGVSLAQGRIKSDVIHVVRNERAGKDEIDGTGLGGYWTHYFRNGAYVDAVVQGTWFDAEAVSMRRVEPDIDDDGFGWAASLEAGVPFRVGDWAIEPQAQAIYQTVDDYDGRDAGARVRFRDIDSLAARIGVRASRAWQLAPALDGAPRALSGWARLNYWHEFEAKPVTLFSSAQGAVPFPTDLTGGWGQLNFGVSAQLGRRTSIYANLNYENGLGGRYEAWDGSIGFRWNW